MNTDFLKRRAQNLARQADEVRVVFNNNARDFAPLAAERLRHKRGQVHVKTEQRKQGTLF